MENDFGDWIWTVTFSQADSSNDLDVNLNGVENILLVL